MPRAATPPSPITQITRMPAMKNKRAPDERDQHGLTEIRLQHEQGDHEQQQGKRHGVGRHFRPPRRFAEQPGDQDHEGRLEEFRRLHVDAEQHDPAARTLDLGAEEHGRDDPEHAERKHNEREAADLPRRQQRSREQNGDGRDKEEHVAVDEMKGVKAEARRHRRARG